jgi:predicted phage tail protein
MNLTPIHLHGHLAKEFGERFDPRRSSPAEAVQALAANFPTFEQYLIRNNLPGYHGADNVFTAEYLPC